MSGWFRDPKSHRLVKGNFKTSFNNLCDSLSSSHSSPHNIMTDNQIEELTNPRDEQSQNNDQNRPRALRDYMNPTRTGAPSCLIFPPDATHFNFKPGIIQLLPTFHGLDAENPYLHLREFEEVCNTYNDLNCSMNTIRLKLFPFSLKDKAKTWLQNLRSGSISSWDELQ